MTRNPYFSESVTSEQALYEDIIIESVKIYGQDIYYLPREIVNEDTILNEDVPSRFGEAHIVEMYIETFDGFGGEGDLMTKFGVEIRDEATFVVARSRFTASVQNLSARLQADALTRPREGDLIYLPMSQSLFQIMHVENDQPFFQLKNLPTYRMRCELFEYSSEDLDTGIAAIDAIETAYAYTYRLGITQDSDEDLVEFIVGEQISSPTTTGHSITGEISLWNDSDSLLDVIHVGPDSGDYRIFEIGKSLTGDSSGATGLVATIEEINRLSENEDNEDFETLDFLNFDEENPFGEPS